MLLAQQILCLFFLTRSLGGEIPSSDYPASEATRRMFDPMDGTRRIDLNKAANQRPYTQNLGISSRISHSRHTRPQSRKQNTNISQIRGSTTFSRLLNIDPSIPTFSQSRYTRQSVPETSKQKILLTNIVDKLDLLDLACRFQPCSSSLRRIIGQGVERRSGGGGGWIIPGLPEKKLTFVMKSSKRSGLR